jgi:hypothetical protein
VDWIHLHQGRDQLRTLVNTVMTVRVDSIKDGKFINQLGDCLLSFIMDLTGYPIPFL